MNEQEPRVVKELRQALKGRELRTLLDNPLAVEERPVPVERMPRPGMGQVVEPLPRVPKTTLTREQLRAQHAQRKANRRRQKAARRAGR